MSNEPNINILSKQEEIALLLQEANNTCRELARSRHCPFGLCEYSYSTDEAISELGLDDELVHQLVEDYVVQVLKTKQLFLFYINQLQDAKHNNQKLDFIPLRELAHKNLGVARNLRIKDGQKILEEMMKQEDLECLEDCVKALEICAIRLKPECAFNTLKLIKIKSTIF